MSFRNYIFLTAALLTILYPGCFYTFNDIEEFYQQTKLAEENNDIENHYCKKNVYAQNGVKKLLTADFIKATFLTATVKEFKNDTKNYVALTQVRNTLGNIIKYQNIEEFVVEDDIVTLRKQELMVAANKNNYEIPITPHDAIALNLHHTWTDHSISIKNTLTTTYKNFFPFLNSLIKKENETIKAGNHVFYHSQRKDIYKALYIETKLYELINDQTFPNFLKLRIPLCDEMNDIKKDAILRECYIKNGTKNDGHFRHQYHLLSTNHTPLANMLRFGESTLDFFAENHNVDRGKIFPVFNLFSAYNLEKHYENYIKELDWINIDTDHGVLLEIVMNDNLAEKSSYTSRPFGKIERFLSKNVLENIQLIRRYPGLFDSDAEKKPCLSSIQWRVVLTDDLLLNPHNPETKEGFKVTAHTLDQKALDEFHQKVDAIFEKIKEEYKKQTV